MDLSWVQSMLFGFLSGLMDILPVSAQAHKVLVLKFLGIRSSSLLMELCIHLAIAGAIYYNCQAYLIRMNRARALARIPKKKRKRPLDTHTLMDWSLLKTMAVPTILAVFLYRFAQSIQTNVLLVALFLFLNGVILYIPQFFPTSNRDSRTLSRVEGLLMGLGPVAAILPGISPVGTTASIASICGVERSYGLTLALLVTMIFDFGLAVYDVLTILNQGLEAFTVGFLVQCVMVAAAAFGGTTLGIRILRRLTQEHGYSLFGVYCWGLALFLFILNLIA